MNFHREALPLELALGQQRCIESQTFKFTINYPPSMDKSIITSIFDSLGFVAPVLLEGKAILQELCCKNIGRDDPYHTGKVAKVEVRATGAPEYGNTQVL